MMANFFDYEGVLFNRDFIQAVSGQTFDDREGGHAPYFRVVLRDDVEWHVEAKSAEELMKKRAAFVKALLG